MSGAAEIRSISKEIEVSAELLFPSVISIFEEAETERFEALGTAIFADGLNETLVF